MFSSNKLECKITQKNFIGLLIKKHKLWISTKQLNRQTTSSIIKIWLQLKSSWLIADIKPQNHKQVDNLHHHH